MAVDKLVDSTQLDSDLTSVANAIRAKSGGSSQLAFPAGFVSEIGNIPSGGSGPQNLTYSETTFVPTEEHGRSSNGGVPNMVTYVKSLLPSDAVFARVSLAEESLANVENYILSDFVYSAAYQNISSTYLNIQAVRIVNKQKANITVTSQPAGWSCIISPNYTFTLEVWSGNYLV